MTETGFCIKCGESREYRIKSCAKKGTFRGAEFVFVAPSAYCSVCGTEMYIPHINDMNVDAAERAYALAKEKEKK